MILSKHYTNNMLVYFLMIGAYTIYNGRSKIGIMFCNIKDLFSAIIIYKSSGKAKENISILVSIDIKILLLVHTSILFVIIIHGSYCVLIFFFLCMSKIWLNIVCHADMLIR